METYTLHDLQNHIKQVLVLNFDSGIWITCEIAQCNEVKGHRYLELVQKDGASDQIIAKSSAALWARSFRRLSKRMPIIYDLLRPGSDVLLKVEVDFHHVYGLKLNILDIDPNYSLGQLERKRQEIIEQLTEQGLMELNSGLKLPFVIQRIAVVSSATAAGYADFVSQLNQNPYGYAFDLQLFQTSMQGEKVEGEMLKSLSQIAKNPESFDAVVITRGGGSKLDLAWFDNYELGLAVAQMPLPVFIGIGHEIDQTILDLVGHTSLKTPTAVANYIIDHNGGFEAAIDTISQDIKDYALSALRDYDKNLTTAQFQVNNLARKQIEHSSMKLYSAQNEIPQLARAHLQQAGHDIKVHAITLRAASQAIIDEQFNPLNKNQSLLENLTKAKLKEEASRLKEAERLLAVLDPKRVLERGYSIAYKDGKVVTKSEMLDLGDELTIRFKEGIAETTVQKTKNG